MSGAALLVGCEWLPNRAGGLNRYFHGLTHSVSHAGLSASAVVTYLRAGQEGPVPLRPMAPEGASLLARWRGARAAARHTFRVGASIANPHFALYAFPWLRDLPAGVPLVVSFHGPWANEMLAERSSVQARLRAALALAIERRVYRRADRLITLSQAFAEVLRNDFGVPMERTFVVPGGFEPAPYVGAPARDEARARLGWPPDRPIVLTVRRLARRMGLEVLIDAAAELRRRHPEVLVLLAGIGAISGDLQARIDRLDLAGNVRLLGFVPEDDLPSAYAAADLTVLPTVALEGFGLSAVESLASGTPVIGTPVGGIPEVLSGLSSDLLAAGCTAPDIAAKLDEVLSRRLALPAPDECRRYAMRFGWEAVWPKVHHLWEEAVDACGRRERA